MQDAKTISTSRVKLHLDMAKASGMYDLWRLSKPKTPIGGRHTFPARTCSACFSERRAFGE